MFTLFMVEWSAANRGENTAFERRVVCFEHVIYLFTVSLEIDLVNGRIAVRLITFERFSIVNANRLVFSVM